MRTGKIITLGMAIAIMLAVCGCPKPEPEFKPLTPELIEEFYNAAVDGDLGHVKDLLAEYPNLINSQESMFNLNALHGAAYGGNLEVVQYLIAQGGDVNARSVGGNTPLVEAAAHNRVEVTEYLCQKGADVNAANNDGDIPLHWAAARGSNEAIEVMIKYGADVNHKNNAGETPLATAVQNGLPDTALILQNAGGN